MPPQYIGKPTERAGAAPPYVVAEFHAHHFVLKSILDKAIFNVQDLIDKQINSVCPKQVDASGTQPVRYDAVTASAPLLSIVAYSGVTPEGGVDFPSINYTEVVVSYYVTRTIGNVISPVSELILFPVVVFIDDRGFELDLTDPFQIPIIVGREVFGMPKFGGKIDYDYNVWGLHLPRGELKIWPNKGTSGASFTSIKLRPQSLMQPLLQRLGGREPAPQGRFDLTARALGVPPSAVSVVATDEEFANVRALANLRPRFRRLSDDALRSEVRLVSVELTSGQITKAMLWDSLYRNASLVGCKQFLDPINITQACYRAVVESVIKTQAPLSPSPLSAAVEINFDVAGDEPSVKTACGIDAPGNVFIVPAAQASSSYETGSFVFGDPQSTLVFNG